MQVFCNIKDKDLTVKRPVKVDVQGDNQFRVDDNIQPVTITKKSVVFSQGNGYWNPTKGSTHHKLHCSLSHSNTSTNLKIYLILSISVLTWRLMIVLVESLLYMITFLKHLARRSLVVNTNTAYPLISLLRCDKYKERGYNISTKEQMSLMFAVAIYGNQFLGRC